MLVCLFVRSYSQKALTIFERYAILAAIERRAMMVEPVPESVPFIELANSGFRDTIQLVGVMPISILEYLDTKEVKLYYRWLTELSPRGQWSLGDRLTIERQGCRIVAVVCHNNGCWVNAPTIIQDLAQDLRDEEVLNPTQPLVMLIPHLVQQRPVFKKICDGLEAIAQPAIISGH
jgi:hypothetical protein